MFKKFFLLLLVSSFLINSVLAKKLNIVLNDLKQGTKGDLMLLVFNNEEAYKSKEPVKKALVQFILKDALLKQKEVNFSVNLPAGEYVVQFYMDKNKNGKLDTNLFGIPTEKFGFTKKYSAIARPKYKDVAIQIKKNEEKKIVLFTKNK